MAEKIAIDTNVFFNHLSNFYASWKADKRGGNTLFGGADSIAILMGKTKTDESAFQKNNALHVRLPPAIPDSSTVVGNLIFPLTSFSLVLASRLRISCYPLRIYDRSSLRRHHSQKG